MHILIVDDDGGAAAATRAFVQHLVPTASVVCEARLEHAWSAAQHTPPDLLVIDPAPYLATARLLMRLCKESWPTMHTAVLTSAPIAPSRRQQFHADAYLEKPASPTQLLEALTPLIQNIQATAPDPSSPI
ncbi:MAG TPA: hypothetical protein VGD58_25275 [Herpetosiphonaceae bacterium]